MRDRTRRATHRDRSSRACPHGLWLGMLVLVASPLSGVQLRLDERAYLSIPAETNDSILLFAAPVGATLGADGTVAVADGGGLRIVVLDRTGRVVRQFGRSGEGPGEFRNISWMSRCGSDQVIAFDQSLDRVTVISLSRGYARAFRPPAATTIYFACSADGGVLAALGGLTQDGKVTPPVRVATADVLLFRGTGPLMAAIQQVPSYEVVSVRGAWLPRPLGRRAAIALTSDALFVGPAGGRAVDVYRLDGTPSHSIPLPWSLRAPPPALWKRALDDLAILMPEGRIREGFRASLADLQPVDSLAAFSALLTDAEGWLWVVASAPGESETRLHAFDRSGRHLGAVRLPGTQTIYEIGHDHVLSALTDPSTGAIMAIQARRLFRPPATR